MLLQLEKLYLQKVYKLYHVFQIIDFMFFFNNQVVMENVLKAHFSITVNELEYIFIDLLAYSKE